MWVGEMKTAIIVGGGYSIKEGISLGLWEKIQGKCHIFSINFAYMTMPFVPTKEIWLDTTFFRNNMDSLYALEQKDCQMITKKNDKYKDIKSFKVYGITREKFVYPVTENAVFVGSNGLSGFFALSVAILQGYDNIYLLGYDFGTPSIHDTNTHFYQDKIAVASSGIKNPGVYLNMNNSVKKECNDFNQYTKCGVTITNVSPLSNITAFPKIDYPTFFSLLENTA